MHVPLFRCQGAWAALTGITFRQRQSERKGTGNTSPPSAALLKTLGREFDLADVRRLTTPMNNFALVELPFGAKLSLVILQQAQPNVSAKTISHQQSCRRQVPGMIQAHGMVHSVSSSSAVRPRLWCTAPGMAKHSICPFSQWTLSKSDVPAWVDSAAVGILAFMGSHGWTTACLRQRRLLRAEDLRLR